MIDTLQIFVAIPKKKRCLHCQEKKPATPEFFAKRGDGRQGGDLLRSLCLECRKKNAAQKAIIKPARLKREFANFIWVMLGAKQCSRCECFKVAPDFARGNGSRGLHSQCKNCEKEVLEIRKIEDPEWWAIQQEKMRGYTSKWRDTHSEQISEYAQRYREENLEECRRRTREYMRITDKRAARHNVNEELYDNLVLAQSSTCANAGCFALGDQYGLYVDHDHKCCPANRSCGKCIRGLVCGPCNFAMGLLGDDPQRVLGLIDYLKNGNVILVQARLWQIEHPDLLEIEMAALPKTHNRALRRHRITAADHCSMFIVQGRSCAITGCGRINRTRRMDLDHDHTCCPGDAESCGACVRGLLCGNCNKALGLLKDDLGRIEGLADYLLVGGFPYDPSVYSRQAVTVEW